MKPVIITICFVLLMPMVCAYGAELLVPSQYPTIQAAVSAAAGGDTVIIAPGIYTGDGNRDITVSNGITIRSQNGPATCIIDCNGSSIQCHRGFTLNAGTLMGLTITGGNAFTGGTIYCEGSSNNPKLVNCVLTGNIGKQGGAIYCRNSYLEITNCSLIGNSSPDPNISTSYGGAIYCEDGTVLVANSTISGNSSAIGGGIYCTNNGNVIIKNCVISENSALSTPLFEGGGGICCLGSMTVIGSDISQNHSVGGAGINFTSELSGLISDCNIHDNVADANTGYAAGGGIYYCTNSSDPSFLMVINSSISNNITRGITCKGGGLYFRIESDSHSRAPIIINGCVVAHNAAQATQNSTNSYGGGICIDAYDSPRQILLSETDITQNSANSGGGIYNEGSIINMSRCRISRNLATLGSVIDCYEGEASFENSVISGNRPLSKPVDCWMILCDTNPLLKITNCTIVGNVPPLISPQPNPSSSIINSIIYSNYRNPCDERPIPTNYFSISYSDIHGKYPGTGNIDADPCFVTAGHWDPNGTPSNYYDDFWVEGDYRLTAVSPCIDSGTYVPLSDNKDLAGNPRIIGAAIDTGAYENNNTPPVAEAGPDQNVFAWIDGNATVTLDGSKSYDADGDKLSYLWNWTIDGNSYEANGVSPAIKLPVGKYQIDLTVNDHLANSLPDDVNITVTGPVNGQLWIMPFTINRQTSLLNILTILKLPAGITKEQIDSGYKLLLYPGGIEAKTQRISQYPDGRIWIGASFDKSAFLGAISTNGNTKLCVVGRLISGQYFFGQSVIRIINTPPIMYPPK